MGPGSGAEMYIAREYEEHSVVPAAPPRHTPHRASVSGSLTKQSQQDLTGRNSPASGATRPCAYKPAATRHIPVHAALSSRC